MQEQNRMENSKEKAGYFKRKIEKLLDIVIFICLPETGGLSKSVLTHNSGGYKFKIKVLAPPAPSEDWER
jgi:hypothetical protein